MELSPIDIGGAPFGDAVSRVRFAPASNRLLISSWDSFLRLYDADESALRMESCTGDAALLDCCFAGEEAALVAGSDGLVRRYDLSLSTPDVVGKHDDCIICVEYSVDTGNFYTLGLDNKLILWDMRMKNCGCAQRNIDSDASSLSVSAAYLTVAVGSKVYLHDLRQFSQVIQEESTSTQYHVRCVRSSPPWHGYVTGSVDGCVSLKYFSSSTHCKMGYTFRCHPKSVNGRFHPVTINDIALHPCHSTFVSGDNEGYVLVWDAQRRKKLFEFPRLPYSVASMSYNHSGEFLAVSSSYTYQEANELEETPQIFIHRMDDLPLEGPAAKDRQ